MDENWTHRFPGLDTLDAEARSILVARARVISMPQDTVIFGPGKAPENLLLLVSGTIRVHETSEAGREIVLYRVFGGESCVLTTACLLAYEDYAAEGIAESDIEAVAIPRETFDSLIAKSTAFRKFVFTAYSRRITELFHVIQDIAFSRIDIRLAHAIINLAGNNPILHTTHHQLASELGTAREVISRQLHEFQRRRWVDVARGEIQLTNRPALVSLAAEIGHPPATS